MKVVNMFMKVTFFVAVFEVMVTNQSSMSEESVKLYVLGVDAGDQR